MWFVLFALFCSPLTSACSWVYVPGPNVQRTEINCVTAGEQAKHYGAVDYRCIPEGE
jgi:hypothetical protein